MGKSSDELQVGDVWRLTHIFFKDHILFFVVKDMGDRLVFRESRLGFLKEIQGGKNYSIIGNVLRDPNIIDPYEPG